MKPRELRILQVISSVDAEYGGPSTALWNLLEALRRRGIAADLATTCARRDVSWHRGSRQQPLAGGGVVRYFRRQTRFYYASLPLLRWLASNVRNYDVVHLHGLFSFAPTIAGICARSARVPYIMRPYGTLNAWGREHRRPALKKLSIAAVERPILNSAARIHFVSRSELEQARDVGFAAQPIVLPLGLDVTSAAALPVMQPHSGAAPVVLFLSRIDPIKNLDLLLDAFALVARTHPTATLVVAGDGPPDLVQSLRSRADGLGIGRKVQWVGFVRAERKAALLQQASLFVLPSASENFGVAAAEAMAAGLPVVVSKGVGISDIIAEAGAGLIVEAAVEQIASAIARLLSDEDERRRMGLAGHTLVAEKLSLEAMGRNLEELYASIANATPKRPREGAGNAGVRYLGS